ncbi:uncharacterized protein LOC124348728 [Daphnia pulicaria]|nr:uncharacterized protein LOC124348728 [Daphnia pulicaria]
MKRSTECKDQEKQEKASTVAEREEALRTLIQKIQEACFGTDVKTLIARKQLKKTSRLVKLTPFIDKNKILRVGGRLENATELYESRHPIVLDPDHHLSILLITEAHVQTAHAGVERTLVEVRVKYWPLKGRRAIRRVVKKCVECKIQRVRPAPPMMAPLPRPRLEPFQPAFASVGLDFFGP